MINLKTGQKVIKLPKRKADDQYIDGKKSYFICNQIKCKIKW